MRRVILLAGLAVLSASSAQAVPNVLTYQGSLLQADGQRVADGAYDMQFSLFDVAASGAARWTETDRATSVTRGLFATILGDATAFPLFFFSGPSDFWLEVAVDLNGNGTFEAPDEVFGPRQRLSSAPWALQANVAFYAGDGPFWRLNGNAGIGPTLYLGTRDTATLELRVGAQPALRLFPAAEAPNVVGGHSTNTIDPALWGIAVGGGREHSATARYATIGGGFRNTVSGGFACIGGGQLNSASGSGAVVVGGVANTAGASYATVGGGQVNSATSEGATVAGGGFNRVSARYATVSGGWDNITTGGAFGTIAGGEKNRVRAPYGVVSGGSSNTILANYATVPGGLGNTADGTYSFAAGRRAKADHDGSFVLADSTNADLHSARANALSCRFRGGVGFEVNDGYWLRIYHNAGYLVDVSNGAGLTEGGTWVNGSDRASKENFVPVSGREVLAKLAALPIATWNYKAEDAAVRHMGPMAQDLHAAFGLGADDKSIATIDADGIALAAVQGVHGMLLEKDREIERLAGEKRALEQRVEDLEARMRAIEAALIRPAP